ncbi:MAG: ribosome recycling factor [Acidimicrobiia bacterium]|nr:ribosome recycling factor [Acidimicrobiia bacterium]
MIADLLTDARRKMEHACDHVASEFATVRTGRANSQILHRVSVDYYGTLTPLQQLASFSVPDPRTLVVQPYDRGSIGAIEKSIRSSDLGLNPSNDGNLIRLAFPALTEERRRELIKVVRHMGEEGRVAVRNVRRHAKEEMEALHGELSDDDIRRGEKDLQDLTDKHIQRIDDQLSHKEAELLEV